MPNKNIKRNRRIEDPTFQIERPLVLTIPTGALPKSQSEDLYHGLDKERREKYEKYIQRMEAIRDLITHRNATTKEIIEYMRYEDIQMAKGDKVKPFNLSTQIWIALRMIFKIWPD